MDLHWSKLSLIKNKNKNMEKVLGVILLVIGGIALVTLLLGWPLMLLWNWLMPTIFGLPIITFWQAVGLNLLSTIIFKSQSFKSNK
jgi:hypothetical protein